MSLLRSQKNSATFWREQSPRCSQHTLLHKSQQQQQHHHYCPTAIFQSQPNQTRSFQEGTQTLNCGCFRWSNTYASPIYPKKDMWSTRQPFSEGLQSLGGVPNYLETDRYQTHGKTSKKQFCEPSRLLTTSRLHATNLTNFDKNSPYKTMFGDSRASVWRSQTLRKEKSLIASYGDLKIPYERSGITWTHQLQRNCANCPTS